MPGPVTDTVASLRAALEQAHARVAALEAQLAAARAERMADPVPQRDDFIAAMVHELRNPLGPIRTTAALLRTRQGDELVAHCGEVIDRQVTRMGRLLDDLLDLSHLSRGLLTLELAPVVLGEVIAAAVEQARPAVDGQRHALTVAAVPPTLVLEADAARPDPNPRAPAGPCGAAHAARRSHRRHGARCGRDRGGDRGRRRRYPGRAGRRGVQSVHAGRRDGWAGACARPAPRPAAAALHGGTVVATNAGPGRGGEVTLRLPLTARHQAAASEAPGGGARRTWWTGRRVLVADDNHDGAEMLELLLSAYGGEVRVVHDGAAAVREAATFRPDVALLDLGMPGVDGLEACRRIRAEAGAAAPLLVAVTGWAQAEDRRQTEDAGFDAHVVKPVDVDVLVGVLSAIPPRSGR